MGLRNLIVESDAEQVVQLISDQSHVSGTLLLMKIRDLLGKNWQVNVVCISREHNKIVDALVKRGISTSSILDICPFYLRSWINQEDMGLNSLSI